MNLSTRMPITEENGETEKDEQKDIHKMKVHKVKFVICIGLISTLYP